MLMLTMYRAYEITHESEKAALLAAPTSRITISGSSDVATSQKIEPRKS